MQTLTAERLVVSGGRVKALPADMPKPMTTIDRVASIVELPNGCHSIMVDGLGYGIAARAETLEPARRLLGGACR